MALIVITNHAAKRFRQRKGINIMNKPKKEIEAKALQAVALMKSHLCHYRPASITLEGDKYFLSYNTSVEGEDIVTVRTVIPEGSERNHFKEWLKGKLKKLINDW